MTEKQSIEELKKNSAAALAKLNAECGEMPEEDLELDEKWQRKLDEFHAKYPEYDSSERAWMLEDGSIHVHYSTRTPGIRAHGDIAYKPDDTEFERIWNRHRMSEAKGRSHFIMKKWDEHNKVWIDLGEGWGS